jgi:hypothetical protein
VLLPHAKRRSNDYRIAAAFFAGTTGGALLSALTLWALSGFFAVLDPRVRLGALAAGAALIWVLKENPGALPFSLPETKRQIPAQVFGQRLDRAALVFGFQLGTGVTTYVSAAAPYAFAWLLFVGWLPLGLALSAALGFGLGRTLPLLTPLSVARSGPIGSAFLPAAAADPRVAFLLVLIGGAYLV